MTRITKDKTSCTKFTTYQDHDQFLSRISKTLYYTKLPVTDCLSLPVTELAAEIFTEVKNGQTLERLDVEEASRISRNACVSPCAMVLALLYLERLKDCNPEYLQRVAPSELFLVSLLVASKFLHDDGVEEEVYNTEWANSGDICVAKMNSLEQDFLHAIDWTVYVHKQDFWKKLQRLEKDIAYKEAQKRGWFSYTELNTLLDSVHLSVLVNTVLRVSSICIATYAAGLITLLGSTIIATHLPETFLSTKEETQCISISNSQFTPSVHESSKIKLEQKIEDILLDSISDKAEMCNESYIYKDIFKQEIDPMRRNGWEWILDSVTFWLPNCSNSKSNNCNNNEWENEIDHNDIRVTKTDFIVESDPFSQYSDVKNIITKQAFDLSLKLSTRDWNHYDSCLSKVVLSHGQ